MLKPRKLCQIDLLFLSYLLQSRGTVLPVASAVGLRGIWRTQQQLDKGLSTKSQRQHPTIDDATFQFFQPIQSYFQENDHKAVLSCEVDFGSDIHCPPPEPSVEQVPICSYNEATCSYSVQCLDANSAGVALLHNPHSKTYCGPCKKSFDTKDELQAAVDRYEKYNIVDMELADKYGWPIGRWHVERITDMANLFFQKQTFNEDISQWDVGLVTNMDAMFQNAYAFDQPLNDWDVSRVTSMERMFAMAVHFNQPLDRWDVSNVKSFAYQFIHALQFDQDLCTWQVVKADDLNSMFLGASNFRQELSMWKVNENANVESMCQGIQSSEREREA